MIAPARSRWITALFLGVAALVLLACGRADGPSDEALRAPESRPAARIVSVGGSVTEIVYALGAGSQLVGVDTSSVYPEETKRLPRVGYQRTIAAEGVIALRPTLVLLSAEAGPPTAIEQLEAAGVTTRRISGEASPTGAAQKIREVAAALALEDKGQELVQALEAEIAEAQRFTALATGRPRVLFLYARGPGTMLISGSHTAADAMIRLAGADNAVTAYEGFKPMTPEAVIAAAPAVILVPSGGLESLGGIDAIRAFPGIAQSPAAAAQRVVAMDDGLLLGFGVRTGAGMRELGRLLHPEIGADP